MRFFLLFFLLMEFLSAGEKVALLIGNNQYQFQPLSNPLNDVKEINKTLLKIGFKSKNIIVVQNGSQREMENAIYQFHKKANDKEIALVYFSGHGIQVENNNYLFPANTTAHKESDLKSLIQLKLLIDSTSSAKYGVILVDACRTNPLVNSFKYEYKNEKKELNSKGKKGLGQVDTQQKKGEFVIGFATSAGNTADDGQNSYTSPYVESLIRNLQLDLEIRKVLGKVGNDVKNKHPHQNPIVKSTLGDSDVCLTGNCGTSNIVETNKSFEVINNLMYQNQPFQKRYTWEEASTYCKSLTLNNHNDWRLPSIYELKILIPPRTDYSYSEDKSLKVRKEFYKNMEGGALDNLWFWSLSEFERDIKLAWFVRFSGVGATDDYMSKERKLYSLCVRGK